MKSECQTVASSTSPELHRRETAALDKVKSETALSSSRHECSGGTVWVPVEAPRSVCLSPEDVPGLPSLHRPLPEEWAARTQLGQVPRGVSAGSPAFCGWTSLALASSGFSQTVALPIGSQAGFGYIMRKEIWLKELLTWCLSPSSHENLGPGRFHHFAEKRARGAHL